MQESSLKESKNDNSKVPTSQKPAIAAKPKYIPPVKLKRIPREDVPQPTRRPNLDYGLPKEIVRSDKKVEYSERYTTQMEMFQPFAPHVPPPEAFKNGAYVEYTVKYEEYTKCTEKCDKFSLHQHKTAEESTQTTKAPSSPSTVCCSILSNAATDCCGIINNPNKKELNGKTMTKVDSVDSNSSDSGGFKDFVQLDVAQKMQTENNGNQQSQTHQRMASQGELLPKDREVRVSHQRKSSQPEFSYQENRQSQQQPKQTYVVNAQALAQFLPQEQRTYKSSFDRPDDSSNRQHPVGKINIAQTSQLFLEKSEDKTQKPRPQLIPHSQFQQSTKKIEELLSQRYEKERSARKGQSCLVDGESSLDVEQKMFVQKQIQQKLQADLQQTVKQIQEIQSIELRLPQNRKWTEVCIKFLSILCIFFLQIVYDIVIIFTALNFNEKEKNIYIL